MAFAGSSGLIQVGVAMTLQDNFSATAGRLSNEFKGMMRDVQDYSQALNMANYGFQAGKAAVEAMTGAYQHYAEVQKDAFLASTMGTRYDKVKLANMKTEQERLNYMKSVREANTKALVENAQQVNAITPLNLMDITSGQKFMAMAGNTTEDLQAMTKPAAELASIFSMPLGGKGGIADLMTNISATFGLTNGLTKAADKAKVFTDMADKLFLATTQTNMSMRDLANSFLYSGAEFRSAGIDMATGAALIGVLGDRGIQGSSAGTALANQLRYLQLSISGQKKKGSEALQAIGLTPSDLVDAQGNLLRIDKIIKAIGDHLGKNASSLKRTDFYYNVLGVRGSRAMDALLADYWSGNSKLTQVLNSYKDNSNKGIVDRTQQEYLETAQGKLDKLRSTWENFIFTFGSQISPVLTPLIGGLSKIVTILGKITGSGVGAHIARIVFLSTVMGTILAGMRMMYWLSQMLARGAGEVVSEQEIQDGVQGRINTKTKLLVAMYAEMVSQLRTMVGLQIQLAAAQGYRGPIGNGSRITGVNAQGNAIIGVPTSVSKNGKVGVEGYTSRMPMMYMTQVGNEMGNVGRAAAGAGAAARAGTGILGGIKKFISGPITKGIGFLCGPVGMIATFLLPLVIDLISSLVNEDGDDKVAEAVNNQTASLDANNKYMMNNMEGMVESGMNRALDKHPMSVTIDARGGGGYSGGSGDNGSDYYGMVGL